MLLKACLNGARRAGAHPALPVTPDELAAAARAAVEAGAGAVHVHPRDATGAERLTADVVDPAVAAIRSVVPGVPVGVTTGAWVEPDPARRVAAVASWTEAPDFASVNVHEEGAEEVAEAVWARGVGVEAGVWTPGAAAALLRWARPGRCLRVLVEPRDGDAVAALATAAAIEAALDEGGLAVPRLLHGHDAAAWPLLAAAVDRGHDARVGLEDVLVLPDGRSAPDNAALVAAAVALARERAEGR